MVTTIKTNELIVTCVSRDGVTVAVNGEIKWLRWADLRIAAHPITYRGFPDDDEVSAVYAQLLRQACAEARKLRALTIKIHTRTGGATWVADTEYVSGEHAGHPAGVSYADGMDNPHRWMARKEAGEAADRLRKRGYDVQIVEVRI